MIWAKFVLIQLVMLLATVCGWFILLPFCLAKAWQMAVSISVQAPRPIDAWRWKPLDAVYGNPEDGVSGQRALVWTQVRGVEAAQQVPYMPGAPAWWRAYCWSAWRNSCDNLKYVFADPKGPLVTFKLFGRTGKVGWQLENGFNVPVLSL